MAVSHAIHAQEGPHMRCEAPPGSRGSVLESLWLFEAGTAMVRTRGQARKADELPKPVLRKTEAIPGEEDSTLARWPPCAPSNRSRRGPRGGRNQGEAVDWAGLPDACLLCVFECLAGDKAAHAVSACCQSSRPFLLLLFCSCPCVRTACLSSIQ